MLLISIYKSKQIKEKNRVFFCLPTSGSEVSPPLYTMPSDE